MCDEQSLRSACAYAQSDQSLCWSLEYYINIKLLTEHHLEFLSLKGGCTGSSESTLAKMPHCWKSHDAAQLYFSTLIHTSFKANLSHFKSYCFFMKERPQKGININFLPHQPFLGFSEILCIYPQHMVHI